MNHLNIKLIFIALLSFLLSSCSPHSGTGVWKANGENEWGIQRLVVGFEGRAQFTSIKKDNAVWHCFWTAVDESDGLDLKCSPSTDTDNKQEFQVTVNDQGFAELRNESTLLATFTLQDENPSPRE